MGNPRIWLLTASPRSAATGAIVTVRLGGGGTRGFNQFGSVDWKAGLVRPPLIAQRLGYDGGQFGDGSIVQALQMAWGGRDALVKSLAALHWRDQAFTLHSGPEGGSDAEMILILSGRFADVTTAPGQLIMAMADPAVDLTKPLISATFGGSGGIEGDAEIKGDAKWRGWGALYNVTLRSLDKANNIHVATDPAFPIQAFDQIYDKGNAASALTLVNWAGSIAATLAALIASAPPAGGAAVAPSIACIKWWYPVPGKLTCDLRGEIGAGYVDRPADIAARMIGIAAGPAVDNASVVLARAARNHVAGWLISDASATTATELTAMLSGVSLWWGLTAAGVIEFGTWAWDAPVATLKAERIDRVQSFKPVSKVSLGWKRNQSVMSRGDIAGVVLYGEVAGVPTTLAGVNAGEGAKLTGIEPGADVTMQVTAPPPVSISCDYLGSVKTGQLPLDLNFKLLRASGADITTTSAWSAIIKTGSASFTIGPATGILNVTACSADVVFEVSALFSGATRKAQTGVMRLLDPPPAASGGGSSGSDSTISASASTSYGAANGGPFTAIAGSAGQVGLGFPGEFTRTTNGSMDAFGKWQWRVIGGTFADVGTEIGSTSPAFRGGFPEPSNDAGSITVTQTKTGLTAGTSYEFQLLLRNSGAGTLNWIGTATGIGS